MLLLLLQHLFHIYVTCPSICAEKITFGPIFLNIHSEGACRIFQVRTRRYVLGCSFVIYPSGILMDEIKKFAKPIL